MKTYEFKNKLFTYLNNKIIIDIPELTNKVFRERLKINQPKTPYLVMKSGERTRVNKRHERFTKDNKEYTRVQYRLFITFAIHDIRVSPIESERFSDNVIDYIEKFFLDDESTHSDLSDEGIIVNELLASGVRDTSNFSETNQEFIREIDIAFEFEDLVEIQSTQGLELETKIQSQA